MSVTEALLGHCLAEIETAAFRGYQHDIGMLIVLHERNKK